MYFLVRGKNQLSNVNNVDYRIKKTCSQSQHSGPFKRNIGIKIITPFFPSVSIEKYLKSSFKILGFPPPKGNRIVWHTVNHPNIPFSYLSPPSLICHNNRCYPKFPISSVDAILQNFIPWWHSSFPPFPFHPFCSHLRTLCHSANIY